MSSFLILHGLEGSGPDHWQTWLAGRLRERGERVSYPRLPDPFDPHPADWDRALTAELDTLDAPVVLCHSLACLLWLRVAARPADGPLASRVLLVAPPCRDDVEPVARFLDHGARARDVTRAAEETLIVCSDDDPYCPPGAVDTYAEPLGIAAKVLPGTGHINSDAGFGEWPWAEAWALGEGG
jgi:predicted alpha/beta hydrolase family esterase